MVQQSNLLLWSQCSWSCWKHTCCQMMIKRVLWWSLKQRVGHLKEADTPRHTTSISHLSINPNMMRNHAVIDCVRSAEWDVPETNQTLSVRRNSEGALSVPPNKCSLWWKHQFWHQCHIWLTCGSLAKDWIVNEMYPSREGWALDRSGFVITAGAAGETVSASFSLTSFHKELCTCH